MRSPGRAWMLNIRSKLRRVLNEHVSYSDDTRLRRRGHAWRAGRVRLDCPRGRQDAHRSWSPPPSLSRANTAEAQACKAHATRPAPTESCAPCTHRADRHATPWLRRRFRSGRSCATWTYCAHRSSPTVAEAPVRPRPCHCLPPQRAAMEARSAACSWRSSSSSCESRIASARSADSCSSSSAPPPPPR